MRELTKEEFIEAMNTANENGTTFDVTSVDIGNVYFDLCGCHIYIDLDNGMEGEIYIRRDDAPMGITFDFDIVDYITEEVNSYGNTDYEIEFTNGLSNIQIVKAMTYQEVVDGEKKRKRKNFTVIE